MRWIYILECEDDYYYVGETKRLYTRFWEHLNGNGALNTKVHIPKNIVALYKVNIISKFVDYNNHISDVKKGCKDYYGGKLHYFNEDYEKHECNNLESENNITECLMIHNKDNWNKIRGGKYTRFDCNYKFPKNDNIKYLPLCKCGLPCDIKKNDKKRYLFFRCAKKNMWNDFREMFDITDKPCDFYKEYTRDKKIKLEDFKEYTENRKKVLRKLFKKSSWLDYVDLDDINSVTKCLGGCLRTNKKNKINYGGKKINLCYDCFINKNEKLSKKYNIFKGKCLI